MRQGGALSFAYLCLQTHTDRAEGDSDRSTPGERMKVLPQDAMTVVTSTTKTIRVAKLAGIPQSLKGGLQIGLTEESTAERYPRMGIALISVAQRYRVLQEFAPPLSFRNALASYKASFLLCQLTFHS